MSSFLEDSTRSVLIFRYTIVATVCFVIYEYLINLDHEVRYLWRRRLSFGTAMLFFCRYLPIAQILLCLVEYVLTNDLRTSNCSRLVKANSALVYLQFCLSNMVLYTRAYAVWAGNKKVLALLIGTYIISAIGTAYTVYLYIQGATVIGASLMEWMHLQCHRPQDYIRTDWQCGDGYIHLTFSPCSPVALSLILYKSVQHANLIKNLRVGYSGDVKVSILTVMAQDGIIYFLLNLVITITSVVVLERAPDDLRDFLVTTQSCVQNVLCARLHFHLQTANGGWMTNTTIVATPNASVEMKLVARDRARRNGSRYDFSFPEDSTIRTEHSVTCRV